jgi:hypothetical protein
MLFIVSLWPSVVLDIHTKYSLASASLKPVLSVTWIRYTATTRASPFHCPTNGSPTNGCPTKGINNNKTKTTNDCPTKVLKIKEENPRHPRSSFSVLCLLAHFRLNLPCLAGVCVFLNTPFPPPPSHALLLQQEDGRYSQDQVSVRAKKES